MKAIKTLWALVEIIIYNIVPVFYTTNVCYVGIKMEVSTDSWNSLTSPFNGEYMYLKGDGTWDSSDDSIHRNYICEICKKPFSVTYNSNNSYDNLNLDVHY